MTPEELARLKELNAVATPAPWYFDPFGTCADITDASGRAVLKLGYDNSPGSQVEMDAVALTTARNALPALLDHIDNLTRQIEACGSSGPKEYPDTPLNYMTLGGIQKLLHESGALPKDGDGNHE